MEFSSVQGFTIQIKADKSQFYLKSIRNNT